MTIGYRYTCKTCGAVLADTSLLPSGTRRDEASPGGFFSGRRLGMHEVPRCRLHPRTQRVETEVAHDPASFGRGMARWEEAAEEVGAVLRPLGFFFQHTGGGCTAFEAPLPDKGHVLLTDFEDAVAPEKLSDGVAIGFYDSEGEYVDGAMAEYRSVSDFVAEVAAAGSVAEWARTQRVAG